MLHHIGKFTETLHKIHTFVEAQQNSSRVKKFFHQSEMTTLLRDCKMGLQQGLDAFQVKTANVLKDITEIQEDAERRHKEVLDMIEALSDTTSSNGASFVWKFHCSIENQIVTFAQISRVYSSSYNSSNSISMLPSEPKIFHGRESEISDILQVFQQGVDHLALMITMRGAERPAKVAWTRPFLQPLKPLEQDAARQILIDIADGIHDAQEVHKVLALTDNMPLAINLVANLVDSEGCASVLSRWEEEKTSMISDGYDKRSNLDLSISLSLSSPRLNSFPHSKDLLSLLSMLPDGLSDVELMQSMLPIDNILGCKAVLICTALAYNDEHKRLKSLVPIREYMQKIQPPGDHLIQPLLKHFEELLQFFMQYRGTQLSPSTVAQVSSNYLNIQNILQNGLQQGHPDLTTSIYCVCYLNNFSRLIGQGLVPLIDQIHSVLPHPCDHRLEAYFITELLNSWYCHSISNPEALVSKALDHFKHFDDPDLKCRLIGKFYNVLAHYYRIKHNLPTATNFCETAISLAVSTGNTKMHSQGLWTLAWITWLLGDHPGAQVHAYEAQRLASIEGDLYKEAEALRLMSICHYTSGNYKQSIPLCNRARDLLYLCGMVSCGLDHDILNTQAEIHLLKSEYVEARSIHCMILQESSANQSPYTYSITLVNIAEIDVSIGAAKENVQSNCNLARNIFNTADLAGEVVACDIVLADLYLREGNFLAAKTIFERCVKFHGNPEIISYCLEQLGDISPWGALHQMSTWTTVFLVHSLRHKENLKIHKGIQFLGDFFLAEDDEHTAISLFTVALDGFTYMDVHRSRAECLLRLGDISKGHGNLLKAVELWEMAKPLFKRSSQFKQVEQVDERLAGVRENVLEQHRTNLVHLAELDASSGHAEDLDYLSEIENMEVLDLEDDKEVDLVSV
ncbi:hypothetical protein B0H13DRAFT_2513217 [Mycena leptocephala]|nr:hypothetical protein B0H13DRAFT_2513217 [Mycena leptocephala]